MIDILSPAVNLVCLAKLLNYLANNTGAEARRNTLPTEIVRGGRYAAPWCLQGPRDAKNANQHEVPRQRRNALLELDAICQCI
jgi:hypothetical protein